MRNKGFESSLDTPTVKIAGTHLALSICCTLECQLLELSGIPILVAATQKATFDHLPLVARKVCISGSHGAITNEETVLGQLLLS